MTSWISKSDVQQLTGWAPRTIEHKAKIGELRARDHSERGRNGKVTREYAVDSLPVDFQRKLAEQRIAATQSLVLVHRSHDGLAPKLTTLLNTNERALIPDDQAELVQGRIAILTKLAEFADNTNGHAPVYKTATGTLISTRSAMVEHISETFKVSERHVWNLWKRFRKGNSPATLARKKRSDHEQSRFFTRHPHAAAIVEAVCFGAEALGIQEAKNAVDQQWEKLRNPQFPNDKAPSYNTVRNYVELKDKDHGRRTLALNGTKRFKEDFLPSTFYDDSNLRCNQVWISDHMQHDAFCWNDIPDRFPDMEYGAAFRPYLTALIDFKSRKIMGIAWSVNPSSRSITSALRFALTIFGKPETLYTDNGKDFLKIEKENPFAIAASGLVCQLGIKTTNSIPYLPQSKGRIERWFGTLHRQFDRGLGPQSYCGPDDKNRPEPCNAAFKFHKQLRKEDRLQDSPFLPLSEFITLSATYFDSYNRTHEHSGRGMKGRTPNEVFFGECPIQTLHPLAINDCALLFSEKVERTVQEGGRMQAYGHWFEPASAEHISRMMSHKGERLYLACDPNDMATAIVVDSDNCPVAEMQSLTLSQFGATSQDLLAARIRARNAITKNLKQLNEGVTRYARQLGHLTQVERLRQSAQEPAHSEMSADNFRVLPQPAHRKVAVARALAPASPEALAREFEEAMKEVKEG